MLRVSVFERNYEYSVLTELPGSEAVRYFPTDRCESPLLVQFRSGDFRWVGGFGSGRPSAGTCTGVFDCPRLDQACVVSNGSAYGVDVREPTATIVWASELVTQVTPCVDARLLLLTDPWGLAAYSADGLLWKSERLSVYGLRVLSADASTVVVRGELADDEPYERTVDLATGRSI